MLIKISPTDQFTDRTRYKVSRGSTSNLARHLRSNHKEDFKRASGPPVKQLKLGDFIQSKAHYGNTSEKKKKLDGKVAEFLALDMHPASIVEGDGFRSLVKELDSRYVLPTRKTLTTRELPRLMEQVKKSLLEDMTSLTWVAITTDLWSSRTATSYITIKAHFLTKEGELATKVLGCDRFSGRHTAASIQVSQ